MVLELEGELTGRKKVSLSRHLLECPGCREVFEEYRFLRRVLEKVPAEPTPTFSKVREAIFDLERRPVLLKWQKRVLTPVTLATLLLFILLGILRVFRNQPREEGLVSVPEIITLENLLFGVDLLTLIDHHYLIETLSNEEKEVFLKTLGEEVKR